MKGKAKYLHNLQSDLDVKKYTDSETAHRDLCGSYDYCVLCNKKNKYPCASAYEKLNKEE